MNLVRKVILATVVTLTVAAPAFVGGGGNGERETSRYNSGETTYVNKK